jgi:putative endonuclease
MGAVPGGLKRSIRNDWIVHKYVFRTSFPRRRESRFFYVMFQNMNQSYVYMLSSKRNGTLYVGVTSDLIKRIYEHKQNLIDGFTKQFQVHMLVYYEIHHDILEAIKREKQIKKWNRQWKLRLIEEMNPGWKDLYPEITGFPLSRE